MVLVFIFISIAILVTFTILVSELSVNVKELEISNEIENMPLIKKMKISIRICMFNKITIFNKNINQNDLKNIKTSKKFQRIKNKLIYKRKTKEEKEKQKADVAILKKLKIQLRKINLELKVGTEDVVLTSFLICIISIAISIILSKIIKKYDENKYKYKITPDYNNKNSINLNLTGIIDIKLVNIINILFKLLVRGNRFDKRTSYRRSYANSYE